MKLQGFPETSNCVGFLYNQELNRYKVTQSYQRLRTLVGTKNIDQMLGTRNFKAQNERLETGALVKSHNGRNVSVERRVGECSTVESNWTMFERRLL